MPHPVGALRARYALNAMFRQLAQGADLVATAVGGIHVYEIKSFASRLTGRGSVRRALVLGAIWNAHGPYPPARAGPSRTWRRASVTRLGTQRMMLAIQVTGPASHPNSPQQLRRRSFRIEVPCDNSCDNKANRG